LCRDVAGTKYKGEWWEYQANRAIGALLLPRSLVSSALREFTDSSGGLDIPTLLPGNREPAARHLADVFDVNPAVARLRLSEILPDHSTSQLIL
jgi:hypothetical protein